MSSLPVAVRAGAVSGQPQPVIDAGGGLHLRPFVEADADVLVRAYADPAIERWHRRTLTGDEALEWVRGRAWHRWQAETGAEWAVVDGGVVVGRVGLPVLHLGEGVAEVGYWVLPEGRGRGVAGRALAALTDWLFVLGLHRIELMHSVLNQPSCRVAAKNGFGLEGTRRSALLHPDGWHDMHLHARLAPD
ncbi:GNAT family N-acetyltransferase [Terrabacter sp. Soil810]|uniref:GNAT family N-acetyltransferase n=1 Tax=Terrabacter sp. Soil810 TaxID=1736418 RepID=UPI000710F70A|nr:GNAT family protein [Terrabacter sp. Soil810]KRF35608.1 acetyltransferase [Terrabacter sp. Soil810]